MRYRWTFTRSPTGLKVLDEDKGICITSHRLGGSDGWNTLGQPMLSVIRQMMLYSWIPALVTEID